MAKATKKRAAPKKKAPAKKTSLRNAATLKAAAKKSAQVKKTNQLDRPAKLGNPRLGWASDIMAETVRKIDFKYMALVPGASYRGFHDSLVNYLGNKDPQMLICLHEEHSVAIADGYAKVTGEPMAVAIHTNVGLMHASMAIFSAYTDRVPMVIFGANGPIDANKRRPWIDWIHTTKDHAALIRNYIKWDDEPQGHEAIVESIYRANQIARTVPTGPTYVCLDAGLQEEPVKNIKIPSVDRYEPFDPPSASRSQVREAIKLIKGAKLPLMMIGPVGHDKKAWNNRIRLAEALGCAVQTHLRSGAVFPTEHPQHVAPSCFRPSEETKSLVQKADVILNLDWLDFAGFLRLCTGNNQTQDPTNATVIQVTVDQTMHNGWNMDYQAMPAVDLNIGADPDTFINQMLDELRVKPGAKAKVKPAVARIRHWTKTRQAKIKPIKTGLMTAVDFHQITGKFMDDHPKAALGRASTGYNGFVARFRDPLAFMGNDGGGGVGSGPGQAVGMALGLRDLGRLPVFTLGDGDYLMGVNALWTASRMRIPMMVVVMNNRSYFNDEAHQHHVADVRGRNADNRWIGLRIDDPAPDLTGFAAAQGFDTSGPVHNAEELIAEMERGLKIVAKGGRFMIDCWVEPDDALARRRADGGRGEKGSNKGAGRGGA
jgi:benzoylformate decarboxylase